MAYDAADDYDPRKPEYIVPASLEDADVQQTHLLKQQASRLQAMLARRREEGGESPEVMRHYENVLADMSSTLQKQAPVSRPRSRARELTPTRDAKTMHNFASPLSTSSSSLGSPPTDEKSAKQSLQEGRAALPRKGGILHLPSSLDGRRTAAMPQCSRRNGLRSQVSPARCIPGHANSMMTPKTSLPAQTRFSQVFDTIGKTAVAQSPDAIGKNASYKGASRNLLAQSVGPSHKFFAPWSEVATI
jgi:hypothetical protein